MGGQMGPLRRIVPFVGAVLVAGAVAEAQSFPTDPEHFPSVGQLDKIDEGLGVAESGALPQLRSPAIELIKDFEGWRSHHYNCAAKYCTIGYGHLIAEAACNTIDPLPFPDGLTLEEGEALFEEDIRPARHYVDAYVQVDLTDDQAGALVSFVFNLGATNFRNSTLLRRINQERFDEAADQFGRWVYANGQEFEGLVTRRACEAALFRSEISLRPDGSFQRADCASLGVADGAGPPIDIFLGEVD